MSLFQIESCGDVLRQVFCFLCVAKSRTARIVFPFFKSTISWFSSSQVATRAKSSVRLDLMVENDLSEV